MMASNIADAVFSWMLVGPDSDKPLLVRRTIIQEAVTKDGFDALVEAQGRAMAAFSKEIASAIEEKSSLQ